MTSLFIEVFWKSGAILGAALIATTLLRKKSADARRLSLTIAILALFAMCAAMFALPRWTAEIPTVPPPSIVLTPTTQFQTVPAIIPFQPTTQQAAATTPARRAPETLPILWLIVAALLLARFATSLHGLRRLRQESHQIGAAGNIPLLQNDAVNAPVTWGILHPVILVPLNFEHLAEEDRNAILEHELAHIRCHDFLTRTLAEIARALLWFQPLIWIVRRRLREEQELSCDDRVLETGGSPSDYAKLLLNWNASPEIAVGMAHRSCLKKRVCALLDRDTPRTRISSKAALVTCVLALGTAIPLAAITFAAPNSKAFTITLKTPPVPLAEQIIPRPLGQIQLAQNQAPRPATPASNAPAIPVAPGPALTANTLLVIIDTEVTDNTTHAPIRGLGVNDFVLSDDGVPESIRFLEYQELNSEDNSATAIRSYYILGYYATDKGPNEAYRRIKVGLKDPSLAARATLQYRAGYFPSPPAVTATGDGQFVEHFRIPRDPPTATTLPPGVTKPILIYHVDPEYSSEARKAKYSGTIDLSVLVDETGKVADVSVIHPLGMGLDQKAVEAVRQWKFDPATQDGKPLAVQVNITMSFRLL